MDLVSKFQAYLDPNSGGMGQGVAPIGAQVTVTTATEKTINVSFTAQLNSDLLETNANSLVTVAISEYFKDSAYRKSKVYYMEVGAAILSVEGIESVSDLKINNGSIDIDLTSEEIPVIGSNFYGGGIMSTSSLSRLLPDFYGGTEEFQAIFYAEEKALEDAADHLETVFDDTTVLQCCEEVLTRLGTCVGIG